MNQFEIIAEPRQGKGSAESRRLRSTGRVPGIIYGGKEEPESITVDLKDLARQLENEAFFSHILIVSVAGKSTQVVLKDLQRHPVKSRVTHLDLLRVSRDQKLVMNVPVHFLNEESSPGHEAAGLFTHHMTELEVSCLPSDLPESIDLDVGHLDIGDVIHLNEVKLPSGVELVTHSEDMLESPVVSVHHAQKLDVEPTEEEEEAGDVGLVGDEKEKEDDDED